MLFATALDNDGMDVSIGDPAHFQVFDRLGREVMAVAHARKVTPVGFTNFDPLAFMPGTPETASRAAVATLSHRWDNNAKKHSGFWRDLAVRKRRTEVDFLVAPVAELGAQAGVDTPAIRTLVGLVHDIEEGRRAQSPETFGILLGLCAGPAQLPRSASLQ
jgi:2-dehydropantoate 2-reductase